MNFEQQGRDYQRIAAVIRYLTEHAEEQPSLKQLADQAHISEHHFQRLFTRWAGTSPKRFLQFLTQQRARAILAETRSLMDASLELGLSSPGRLHDLTVSCMAATPGEIKSGGRGLHIIWGRSESPFGPALVASTPRGLCHLSFRQAGDSLDEHLGRIHSQWPNAGLRQNDHQASQTLTTIFEPTKNSTLPLHIKGTNFQIKVWEALLRIPSGRLVTYGDVANTVGKPGASRAVGTAVGANHIAYLIPCHRVIRESGALGGYRWGLERKQAMLGWEASGETVA